MKTKWYNIKDKLLIKRTTISKRMKMINKINRYNKVVTNKISKRDFWTTYF